MIRGHKGVGMSDEDASAQAKKKGRPPGKRGTFSFRVTPSLRTQLEEAAAKSQRPVSEEIESRLERSFDAELSQLRIAMFGDNKTETILKNIMTMTRFIENWHSTIKRNPPAAWHETEVMRAAMRKAAQHIIIAATPHGLDEVANVPDPLQAYVDGVDLGPAPGEPEPRPIEEAQHYGLFIAQALTGTQSAQEDYLDFEPAVKNLGLALWKDG